MFILMDNGAKYLIFNIIKILWFDIFLFDWSVVFNYWSSYFLIVAYTSINLNSLAINSDLSFSCKFSNNSKGHVGNMPMKPPI